MRKITIFLCLNLFVIVVHSQEIAKLFKKVNPSVVTILTEFKALNENHQMATDEGLGSGVLISEDGEILTAAHVVNDAEKITVRFLNGEEIPAKVKRSAPVADLALIELSWMPKEFKVVKVGDSDLVSTGDQIIVVGAPYGLEHSLSVGYISGRQEKKTRTSGFTINEFFQTDASINQGNSGGPMFNLKGEIIGISSYIITESGGFQGLGFAATSNLAQKLVIDGNRRWTGISGYFLDETLSWLLNVPINGGLLVESVVKFSPADFAGIKGGFERVVLDDQEVVIGGDIIISVNGLPLTRNAFENLQNVLNELSLEDIQDKRKQKSFEVEVLRGGEIETIKFNFRE